MNVYAAAQKREIRNILKSYTGHYDLFSEMIQNALDAVEKRKAEGEEGYKAKISISIDAQQNAVSVVDNGCAMSLPQFRQFLKPSLSFKDGTGTRGNKGVGTTYLAFGFNQLEVATKMDPQTAYAGLLKDGRTWLEDTQGLITKPNVEPLQSITSWLASLDRGTSITLRLNGTNIRPKNLHYFAANSRGSMARAFSRTHTVRRKLSLR